MRKNNSRKMSEYICQLLFCQFINQILYELLQLFHILIKASEKFTCVNQLNWANLLIRRKLSEKP